MRFLLPVPLVNSRRQSVFLWPVMFSNSSAGPYWLDTSRVIAPNSSFQSTSALILWSSLRSSRSSMKSRKSRPAIETTPIGISAYVPSSLRANAAAGSRTLLIFSSD